MSYENILTLNSLKINELYFCHVLNNCCYIVAVL